MGAKKVGAGYIHGTEVTLGCPVLSGYVSPNLKSLRVNHTGEVSKIKNQSGEFKGLMGSGDFISCEFSVIPEGTDAAGAAKAAGLPPLLSSYTIVDAVAPGLPIVACGPFADALHTNGANTQPWIYEGGGGWSVSSDNSDPAVLTFTLNRYPFITSGTIIT